MGWRGDLLRSQVSLGRSVRVEYVVHFASVTVPVVSPGAPSWRGYSW